MTKKIVSISVFFLLFSVIFISESLAADHQLKSSQKEIITACKVLGYLTKIAVENGKEQEMTIYQSAYNHIRMHIKDDAAIKEIDLLFEELKKRGPAEAKTFIISMFKPPRLIKGVSTEELEAFISLTEEGLEIEDLYDAMTLKRLKKIETLMKDLKRIEEQLDTIWPNRPKNP